ncbi:MAG: hypothetical protein NC115_06190 [Bacteroidales bacterium]|nr:hypothetical protein [Bacteroidales bacterium]
MKRFLTFIAMMLFFIPCAVSQDRKENWREKMRSEKIAFLTNEMDLTPEEAQVFWPVYNTTCEDRDKVQRAVMEAYKALNEAIKSNKPQKEIGVKLDAYIRALDNQAGMAGRHVEEYRKVLPTEKVAKLYLAEEKFRREQIHRLHNRGPEPRGPQPGR